jgi:hypothetical protein
MFASASCCGEAAKPSPDPSTAKNSGTPPAKKDNGKTVPGTKTGNQSAPPKSPEDTVVDALFEIANTGTGIRFSTRLNAIDQIGQIGAKSDNSVIHLRDLLQAAASQPAANTQRTLFALHVVRALGNLGHDAYIVLPELAKANDIDPVLLPAIAKAQNDILNSKPATADQTPPTTQLPLASDSNAAARDEVQKQFANLQASIKSLRAAPQAVDTAMNNLSDAVKKLSAPQTTPAPTQ